MGKRGSWFSAIKRVFIPHSKDKLDHGIEKKNSKERKKGRGILKHGENKSFIPLFREPSSIEKILGEADQQKLLSRPPTAEEQQPKTPPALLPRPTSPSPRAASSPRVASPSPRAASTPAGLPQKRNFAYRPEPTLRNHHLSATKIQAAFRGYMARRSFRALRGLVRLQGVVRGQNVKRQTVNAMKHMQLLVRIQTQIQSRRIQMLENQALQQRHASKNDKEADSTMSKWTFNQMSEAGQSEDWDDSLLTREEIEARMQRRVEAIIKRERAMAYAYSHQLWKATPKSAQTALMDIRSGGFPWWWNWLERQLPPAPNPSQSQAVPSKIVSLTPPRPISDHKPSPSPRSLTSNFRQRNQAFGFDNQDTQTPRSSKSAVPLRAKLLQTPTRTPPAMKFSKPRNSAPDSPFDLPMRDDDSLTSCPPFFVPNYMTPTVSAKAKVRESPNTKEKLVGGGTPARESKKRFSFPLTPNIGYFKWNKGGTNKDSNSSQRVLDKHQFLNNSIGDLSVDSAISMPAAVGRKPFNRFV